MAHGSSKPTVTAEQATAANLNMTEASAADIKTAVELIDNAIDGSEMQVDVVASLPAGTNAIGKLAANSGVDIGDVDVTSVVPGTAATNLGKAEDAGHSSGDVGVMLLAVRQDAVAALAGADLDYAPVQVDATGYLRVTCDGIVAHDAADSGNPVKIGAVAVDYEPDSEGEQGQTAVAAGDVVQLPADLEGLLPERVLAKYELLTGLDQVYDGTPSTAVSADTDCERYRWATLSYELDITATPGTIRFDIEVSPDGSTWAKLTNGPLSALIYDDTSIGGSGIEEAITFPIACRQIRVRVTCTGVDGTDKITLDDTTLYFRN